jgi:oligopeptide/dipeptide ABC transporter ATP-binding protein
MSVTRSALRQAAETSGGAVLSVRDLVLEFDRSSRRPAARPVRGVSFDLQQGQVVSLVGESGSGKTLTALTIAGLQRELRANVVAGSVNFKGRDLTSLNEKQMCQVRGREIGMIFQDPSSSLDPLFTVGWQIGEAIRLHEPRQPRKALQRRVVDLLAQVRIANPEDAYFRYPHEFSGGMQQRVMIATALANSPSLLIADEPTTALDVTVQAQILRLILQMKRDLGLTILLITHDLGIVAEAADRVLVMYAGEIVEQASVEELFDRPRHPYSVALMRSRPASLSSPSERLVAIPGHPLEPSVTVRGCRFQERCWLSRGRRECVDVAPPVREISPDHRVACHFAEELAGGLPRHVYGPRHSVEPVGGARSATGDGS